MLVAWKRFGEKPFDMPNDCFSKELILEKNHLTYLLNLEDDRPFYAVMPLKNHSMKNNLFYNSCSFVIKHFIILVFRFNTEVAELGNSMVKFHWKGKLNYNENKIQPVRYWIVYF